MRRRYHVAAVSGLLLALPLWAQRGGHSGAAIGGGSRGYAGVAHGGGYASPHGGSYGHPGPGYGHPPNGYPHPPYHPSHYPYRPYYPWGWGYGYAGYPFLGYGWYGGLGWYDTYDSYASQASPAYVYVTPPADYANNAYSQQQEIDQLNEEVANLRAQQAGPPAQNYAQRPAPAQIRAETVLVFRDHHTEEIANYAIVGQTLWVFNEQHASKIPISDLDVPATTKANDDRGIVFSLPSQ